MSVGSLRFQFAQAQSTLLVPNKTTRLKFLFTNQADGEGAFVFETTRDFALSITIDNVPLTARSVRVTALDASGLPLLTAVSPVTVLSGQSTTVHFPPLVEVTPTEIFIDPISVELRVGAERHLTVTLRLSDGSSGHPVDVLWSSTGGSALVDSNGRVRAVAPGTARVRAILGTLSDEVEVVVLPSIPEVPGSVTLERFELSRQSLTLSSGASLRLTATGTFSNSTVRSLSHARDGLTFASSDELVATVDDEGRVSAMGLGNAKLTATVGSLTQEVEIAVTSPPSQGPRPVIDLGGFETTTVALGSGPHKIAEGIIITDIHDDLQGGNLTILNRDNLSIQAPSSPDIGAVTGNGGSSVSVNLGPEVSPALVAQFLRGVTVSTDGPQQSVGIEIIYNNGQDDAVFAYPHLEIVSFQVLNLTVDPSAPTGEFNYHNPQQAIDRVVGYGGDGSTITLTGDDFRPLGTETGNYTVYGSRTPNFSILGANAGIPVGVNPQPRGNETVISSLTLDGGASKRVSIDGLTFDPNKVTTPDGPFGLVNYYGIYTVKNCVFGSSKQDYAVTDFSSRGLAVIEDCRLDNIGGGMGLYQVYPVIRRNVFRNLDFGIYFVTPYTQDPDTSVTGVISGNHFENSSSYHLSSYQTVRGVTDISGNVFQGTGYVELGQGFYPLDVRNNWWGQASGPLPSQLRNQSSIANILSSPFLTTNPLP